MTVDLAVCEVINSIWKHQHVLKDLSDGLPYVSILYGLMESGKIRIVRPTQDLMERSYSIATRNRATVHDAVFIALALESGLELMTLDRRQAAIMRNEAGR